MPIIWIAAIIIFGIAEAATANLVSVWFVVGALAGLRTALLGWSVWLQLSVFCVVSAAALALTRPLVRRLLSRGVVPTNADRVLRQTARVTETVDNRLPSGAVYVDGKTWTARSEDGTVLAVDTQVEVVRMEGVTLFVAPRDQTRYLDSGIVEEE